MILGPSPTKSKADLEIKCSKYLFWRAKHLEFSQRETTSPLGFTISWPQTGQCLGILNSFSLRVLNSGKTLIRAGITSPARPIITVSPILTPKRAISSSL